MESKEEISMNRKDFEQLSTAALASLQRLRAASARFWRVGRFTAALRVEMFEPGKATADLALYSTDKGRWIYAPAPAHELNDAELMAYTGYRQIVTDWLRNEIPTLPLSDAEDPTVRGESTEPKSLMAEATPGNGKPAEYTGR
jgi:hypothetical protein